MLLTSVNTKSNIDFLQQTDNYLSTLPTMISTTSDLSRLLPPYSSAVRPPVRPHGLTAHLAPNIVENAAMYPEHAYHHLPMLASKTSPLLSPNLQIAPAFAQIYHRRRRRENRPRRQRTTFTSDQTLQLEMEYTRADYISRPRRLELAATLQLSESQIKIWFQNRRAKDKRIEKAHMDRTLRPIGYQSLPPSYTSQSLPALCTTYAVPSPLSLCVQQQLLASPKSQP